MLRNVKVDDSSPLMGENDEYEQHSKCRSRNNEKIDRHEIADMLFDKWPPRGRRQLIATGPVPFHCRLCDVDSELGEFRNDL